MSGTESTERLIAEPVVTQVQDELILDFPTMSFLIFGLLAEVEEELMRRVAIIFRRTFFRCFDFAIIYFFNVEKWPQHETPNKLWEAPGRHQESI